ncbi:hypothetical protein FJU08_15630 [Martelella alba]|uniref:Uncharacterized protein n=1 Tax=Martelella alba TaxID=2590451 RepID=A0A506U5Y7_9HYPH|nr:hypothetical protein [Martelella alba]TPW28766.1 hypothetical protein FJU08_15630 [Martelella alba]
MMPKACLMIGLLGLIAAGPALAGATDDPVAEVMAVTVNNWSPEAAVQEDLFSPDRLKRLFSRDFNARFEKAVAVSGVGDGGSPFDYDVVVNAQDGCPLEDLTISPPLVTGGTTVETARFRFMACIGAEPAYQAFSETRFLLVDEGGHLKIDDIIAISPDGQSLSARAQLDLMAEDGAK